VIAAPDLISAATVAVSESSLLPQRTSAFPAGGSVRLDHDVDQLYLGMCDEQLLGASEKSPGDFTVDVGASPVIVAEGIEDAKRYRLQKGHSIRRNEEFKTESALSPSAIKSGLIPREKCNRGSDLLTAPEPVTSQFPFVPTWDSPNSLLHRAYKKCCGHMY
jgi:hypothetical protein